MMMRSLRCSLFGLGDADRFLSSADRRWESRRLAPSSADRYPPERRLMDPPDERGGVCGLMTAGKTLACEVSMYSVEGSPQEIFRGGFSSEEVLLHGRPGCPY